MLKFYSLKNIEIHGISAKMIKIQFNRVLTDLGVHMSGTIEAIPEIQTLDRGTPKK